MVGFLRIKNCKKDQPYLYFLLIMQVVKSFLIMKIFIFSRHIINNSKNKVESLDLRLKEEILL